MQLVCGIGNFVTILREATSGKERYLPVRKDSAFGVIKPHSIFILWVRVRIRVRVLSLSSSIALALVNSREGFQELNVKPSVRTHPCQQLPLKNCASSRSRAGNRGGKTIFACLPASV